MLKQKDKFILEIRHISKEYPGVQALKDVSFAIKEGQVHGIVGENGAGKSTLMKILSGVEQMSSGELVLNDMVIDLDGIREAIDLGINLISQELNIAPDMKVYENIFIGSEIHRYGKLDRKKMKEVSRDLLDSLGASFSIDVYANELSVAEQQQVEIARALRYKGNILIMDEPTASLTDSETDKLFEVINQLRDRGITVIFISHRLPEVMYIADSVTVLRDGRYIGTLEKGELDEDTIVKWMVGRELSDYYYHKYNEELPQSDYFVVENYSDNKEVFDVSFSVKKGEIICLAGLVGAGRTEMCNLIFGINKKQGGRLYLAGKELNIRNPYDAIKEGIGYVPEDRKNQGLFLELSCALNVVINIVDTDLISKNMVINHKNVNEVVQKAVASRNIRTPDIDREVMYLSGGNQQKVLLARWLEIKPDILILDEPTRGIDVGAKSEIYELIGELSVKGVTIIIISSDFPEVIGMAQRILVMREGKIVSEIKNKKEFTQENILAYATGIKDTDYLF